MAESERSGLGDELVDEVVKALEVIAAYRTPGLRLGHAKAR